MNFARYAIYYTFPRGPLADFGSAWLGWNAATGERPDAPAVDGLPAPSRDITRRPRKYGLHATIKPPFRLAEGQDFDALNTAFAGFCAQARPAHVDTLEITRLGGFLALTPGGDQSDLNALAGDTVEALDAFRARPGEEELARRRKANLSPAQDALLLQWGYPYVKDEFHFHITLSGRLDQDQAEATQKALTPHLAPLLPRPFLVDALTLCGEDPDGMFHELRRLPLEG